MNDTPTHNYDRILTTEEANLDSRTFTLVKVIQVIKDKMTLGLPGEKKN